MKVFVFETPGRPPTTLGGAGAAKRFLREHPEVKSLVRYWWVGADLVDVEEVPRERLLKQTVKEAERGATAQWAAAHGGAL